MSEIIGHTGNVAIDSQRLWASIMDTARFGATPKGGIRRLTLSEEDRAVRDWFRDACEAIGAGVEIDELGTMYATLPGTDPALPPIAIGSHLDTQPTGGKFDGVIGVLGGLEVLRTLAETGTRTRHPVTLINWTNEEGSRFAPAMLCSGVFAGAFPADFALSRTDRDGITFADALDAIGYRGPLRAGAKTLAAHFELHIEQGPILEAEEKTIGAVTGVQAMRWFEVTLTGNEGHAGATPMRLRQDALVAGAHAILAIERLAAEHAPDAVATVGLLECRPNSRNVVPGEVFLTVDLRHPSDAVLEVMEQSLRHILASLPAGIGVTVDKVWDNPAVPFDARLLDAIRAGARAEGFTPRDIVSGAGHDSAYTARVCPSAMIFVPCAGGLSHNEAESATQHDVAAGTAVLLRAVLEADRLL
ncbi:N-carbamoyl-L-amino-acid hydrolase [Endobacter medicaginis]|uniref:N-carbamoyl-L-amino-acid hydrolase n=1 Tax=Endobacter medicaginis TaxID=1181271 RepID=A0A839V1I0_9PROT|nr:Zn-dependent hydrolase [Endobacter medicaginis]MBB3174384.1 N-carbamoyl-L-amino-acid hydrolase [Endobacter medicaginis]MCX5475331.1 Zn-dependent hydrolase [Endobacter medicaginis]NVN31082.1 Zn-dependent hydrolase [Endobacter medicaginis]